MTRLLEQEDAVRVGLVGTERLDQSSHTKVAIKT